jgi:transcriptional regulator with XRE-family HTH domain
MSLLGDEAPIGQRLRDLRLWRGMTLAEVGGLAGVSAAYLSYLERGLRPLDRRSTISALASALRISETELAGGPHLGADSEQSAPHATIPALRVALSTNTLSDPACERARPLPDLLTALRDQIQPLYSTCDYIHLGQYLPAVIDELHYHVAASSGEADHRRALYGLLEACAYAAFRAKDLGYPDLACLAASRATEAADVTGNPVARGKASYIRLQTMPRSWDRTIDAAERAASTLDTVARDDHTGMQVLGQLCLTAALSAAVLQKPDTAHDWLDHADRLASSMPDEPHLGWHCFSKTNVALWRVAISVERGESGQRIVQLAAQVDQTKLATRRSRLCSFRTDVGRALARDRKSHADALRWLCAAEETAPQRFRNNAAARETVAYLITRARATAGDRELRGMAARMGVPH